MDHRGLRERLAGAGCTSCGAAIPGDRIDVLADRGDLAFVEFGCPVCGSRTMGLVVGPEPGSRQASLDTAVHPEMDPVTEARLAGHPAMTWDDVEDMRGFLARWTGDLRSMLGGTHGPGGGPLDG
jgi:predicted RNA-binding Zn-ribbon protein involved in translation (DUF1610 family)